MEKTYFNIFLEIYFHDYPEYEDLLTEDERREEQNKRASKAPFIIESFCGVDEAKRYKEMVKNEERHIQLVRSAMDDIMMERKGEDPTYHFAPSQHDYTKDPWYIFCTLWHFRYGITEKVSKLTQREIDRHLSLERHHPECENQEHITEPLLTEDDILEMAIDRISRNFQFNNGEFNREQFMKYMPTFRNFKEPGEPDVERIDLYKSFVNEKNLSVVKRHYNRLFI